jgi:hypothetical protein
MVCTSWGNDLISSDVESMTRHEREPSIAQVVGFRPMVMKPWQR